MIRDFVHLIQNKLRHYAVFPSLHSLSRSSAFQTALFLLGVLAFARACIFLAPPSVTTLASASVNGTFMPICRVETDPEKSRADLQLHLQCTRHAAAFGNSERKKCDATFFRFRRLGKKLSGSCSVRFTTPDTISAVCGQRRHLFPSGNRRSHWKISRSELIALPILKRRCFVLKMETMTTLLSGSSRNPAVIRCSGTSIPWTGKTTGWIRSSKPSATTKIWQTDPSS